MAQRTGTTGSNALPKELTLVVRQRTTAPLDAVYDVLVDLRSHVIWAGEHQASKARLLSIDAPSGEATVGTEFASTGSDPMGRFEDRSVVTRAERPSLFEFVTEATLTRRRGEPVAWTEVHRYEVRPDEGGSSIVLTERVTRISALPGMLRVLIIPGLSRLALWMSKRLARRAVRNLVRLAEERARTR